MTREDFAKSMTTIKDSLCINLSYMKTISLESLNDRKVPEYTLSSIEHDDAYDALVDIITLAENIVAEAELLRG